MSVDFRIVHFLRKCPAFSGLPELVVRDFAQTSEWADFYRDQEVVTQGRAVHDLWIPVSGDLDVVVDSRRVASISVFALIGDHEILQQTRFAKATVVVTSSQARLIRIPEEKLYAAAEQHPPVWSQFLHSTAARLRAMEADRESYVLSRINNELNRIEDWRHILEKFTHDTRQAPIIERRFLAEVDWSIFSGHVFHHLLQGYIAIDQQNEIRVRKDGQRTSLTGKRREAGALTEITLHDIGSSVFQSLWTHVGPRKVSKRRFLCECHAVTWRVDVFDPDSNCPGLTIAEIELPESASVPDPPPGVVLKKELTGEENERYRNQQLALYGTP